ncbi:MAG: alpha/beta hydrolase family protein [Bacillota bacterium]
MNLLEIMLMILTVFMLFALNTKVGWKRPYVAVLIAISITLFVAHVILGTPRWQLIPLYLALAVLAILHYLKGYLHKTLKKGWRRGTVIFSAGLIVFSFVSALVFPMREVPAPGGEHLVGTVSFVIEDKDREERYGKEPGSDRRFKVQTWYPAETTEDYGQAFWMDDGKTVARGLSRDVGLPFFTLDHTTRIKAHAHHDAPIKDSSEPYPVVILSHGWRGFRNLHTDIAEELASQGYVVFGIDHAHGSVATVLSENETLYLDPEALPDRATTPDFLDHANRLVSTYAGDITATLDHLESMADGMHLDGFKSALDLDRIGLIGHSTGGGADAAVAIEDERIEAFIGLDAWVEPLEEASVEEGLSVPTLFLRSKEWEESYNNAHLATLIEKSTDARLYQIEGTTHADFAMVYMISPLTRAVGFSGDIERERLVPMLKGMTADFLDETLKDEADHSSDWERWEEVRRIE